MKAEQQGHLYIGRTSLDVSENELLEISKNRKRSVRSGIGLKSLQP